MNYETELQKWVQDSSQGQLRAKSGQSLDLVQYTLKIPRQRN